MYPPLSHTTLLPAYYPAPRILPCASHTTLLLPYYPAPPILPCFSHTTLLFAYYPAPPILPCFSHTTLLLTYYPDFRRLPCFSHTTLLLAYYPDFRILPCSLHTTLLLAYYPAPPILPCSSYITLHLGSDDSPPPRHSAIMPQLSATYGRPAAAVCRYAGSSNRRAPGELTGCGGHPRNTGIVLLEYLFSAGGRQIGAPLQLTETINICVGLECDEESLSAELTVPDDGSLGDPNHLDMTQREGELQDRISFHLMVLVDVLVGDLLRQCIELTDVLGFRDEKFLQNPFLTSDSLLLDLVQREVSGIIQYMTDRYGDSHAVREMLANTTLIKSMNSDLHAEIRARILFALLSHSSCITSVLIDSEPKTDRAAPLAQCDCRRAINSHPADSWLFTTTTSNKTTANLDIPPNMCGNLSPTWELVIIRAKIISSSTTLGSYVASRKERLRVLINSDHRYDSYDMNIHRYQLITVLSSRVSSVYIPHDCDNRLSSKGGVFVQSFKLENHE
ncbi:hypothetical protein J6590_032259 [Homalodisca vitripennis]|nr:hypothetical protein J6590_032259 [Homalodisca vitripennis]